jgi:ATP-dependent RNA helicase DeaD
MALAQADRIQAFRDIVGHYVANHDVPEADVAAALAVVAQGDTPLLLDPAEEARAPQFVREDRPLHAVRQDGPKAERYSRDSAGPTATYRIAVGKRHKVEPRQIVGAIANEGGLSRGDFGAIKIHPNFSLVDLPANLPGDVLGKLSRTRISGVLIDIQLDGGTSSAADQRGPRYERADRPASGGYSRDHGAPRADRGDRPDRKPRHQ